MNKYVRMVANDSTGSNVMRVNTMTTPIVATMGPIAFSTNDEKKNAIEETVIIPHAAKQYDVTNLDNTSASGKTRMPCPITNRSPLPRRASARPALKTPRKPTNRMV
ncbi:MAG TPA: hypothetical protein VMM37_10605 [Bacteroidota bacterium]|nr:hypothetical protein [Bacteroidota bacterium]